MNVGAASGSGIMQQSFPVPAPTSAPVPKAVSPPTKASSTQQGTGDHRSSDCPSSESVAATEKADDKAAAERAHKASVKRPATAPELPPLKGITVEDFRLILGANPVKQKSESSTPKAGTSGIGTQDVGTQIGTQTGGQQGSVLPHGTTFDLRA